MREGIREQAIEALQMTARRLCVRALPPAVFDARSDGELVAWLRRLAVIEFEQTRGRRYDAAHD